MNETITQKLEYLIKLKEQKKELETLERRIRGEVVAEYFSDHHEGEHSKDIMGHMVSCKKGVRTSIDKKLLSEASPEIQEWMEETVLTKSFTLNKRAYDKLPPAMQLNVDNYLTTKPSLPTLEIK